MDLIVASYCVYLCLGILLVVIAGRALFNGGVVYVQDVFVIDQELASATNQFLRDGFIWCLVATFL